MNADDLRFNLKENLTQNGRLYFMSAANGTDWTQILSDPDLVRHVGKLLQTYREAPVEKRESALLEAMREIKAGADATGKPIAGYTSGKNQPQPVSTPASATPPFEPDLFSPNWGSDRRRHPRLKCFVAVELRVDDAAAPIWGNLSNTSVGGCLVETVSPVKSGSKVEIGLWLANGKIWVKGFAISGVVTRSGPASSIRLRFDVMAPSERDSLRQFLKFVQETTHEFHNGNSYLQLLK